MEASAYGRSQGPMNMAELLRQLTVENDRFMERMSAARNLHRTDMHALSHIMDSIRSRQPVTAGSLGSALGLSSPATTALIDRLERAGMVVRVRGEIDRRQVHLELTAEAGQVGREVFGPLFGHFQSLYGRYSHQELELARNFLLDLIGTIHDAAEGDAPGTSYERALRRPDEDVD